MKTIEILPNVIYTVNFVEANDYHLYCQNEGEEQASYKTATCHFVPRQIYISKDLPRNRIKSRLIHELTHAILHETYPYTIENEEMICWIMETWSEYIVDMINKNSPFGG